MFPMLDKVETPDEKTVVFQLKVPDATFPSKIASGAGSIVDHREYDADGLREDGKAVGSGPYKLDSFSEDEAVFSVNENYEGNADVAELRRHPQVLPRRPQGPEQGPRRHRGRRRLPRPRRPGHRRHRERHVRPARASTSSRAPAPRCSTWSSTSTTRSRQARRPQGHRPPPRPRGPRRGGLRVHGDTAVLDHPGRHHRPQHGLLRHLRRPPLSAPRPRTRCAPTASPTR